MTLLLTSLSMAAEKPASPEEKTKPAISISEDMGDAMAMEAARVKADVEHKARSLFRRTPLGWDWKTVDRLKEKTIGLPGRIPKAISAFLRSTRLIPVLGIPLIALLLVVLLYRVLDKNRIIAWLEKEARLILQRIPQHVLLLMLSLLRVIFDAVVPLLLLGIYSLLSEMTLYRAAWFQFSGKVLVLWIIGALILGLLRELLTSGIFSVTATYGKAIFRLSRLALLSILFGIALLLGAASLQARQDVIAFLSFLISLAIVMVLSALFLKKKAFLSFIPELPYGTFQTFTRFLKRYYYPLILFSSLTALLWCLGYKQFGEVVLTKTWSSVGMYLLIMIIYHFLRGILVRWSERTDPGDEAAKLLYRSLKALLLFAMIIATVVVILNLLGLLHFLQRIMSFPVLRLGVSAVSFWTILEAILILMAFVFTSRMLQAYLDYRIYPRLGVDQGQGYALNTFIKYFTIVVGFLVSLKIMGIDLRLFMVFAGAIGIGIGLGLQNMAANVFSGLGLIFGRKIRKGDVIEVGNAIGTVTDIYLRATRIRTAENVEIIVPNSDFTSKTVVNYSMTSSLVRISIPVGVSYETDPRLVEKTLLELAMKEPLVEKQEKPEVRFLAYNESSMDFELLVWIDVRKTPGKKVQSNLYFAVFDAFKKEGIEIPFPQRDIHIRSQPERI